MIGCETCVLIQIPDGAKQWEFEKLFGYVIDMVGDKYETSRDRLEGVFIVDEIMSCIWYELKGGNRSRVLS